MSKVKTHPSILDEVRKRFPAEVEVYSETERARYGAATFCYPVGKIMMFDDMLTARKAVHTPCGAEQCTMKHTTVTVTPAPRERDFPESAKERDRAEARYA